MADLRDDIKKLGSVAKAILCELKSEKEIGVKP